MSMDAKRLAQLEAIVSGMGVGHQASNDLVEELITAHGDLVRETKCLRSERDALRARIIDSAVTHYGLTHSHWAQSEEWPWPAKSEAPESEQE